MAQVTQFKENSSKSEGQIKRTQIIQDDKFGI